MPLTVPIIQCHIHLFLFSLKNVWLPCRLGKAVAVLWAANRFVGSETPKHIMLLKSNIFHEMQDFLVLMDPVIICIYLRTTYRHFCDQSDDHHLTSKLLKCDLVQTLNTFQNPFLQIFAAGKTSLVIWWKRKTFIYFIKLYKI